MAVVGGAPSTASSVRSATAASATAASPADHAKGKSKSASAAGSSATKPKAAHHPPVIVSSGPLVEPNPKPAALQVDDFPPLPSKNGGATTPPTPKQSYSSSSTPATPSNSNSNSGAPQPPLTPHRSLANQAADMLAANAAARANKTQQLSSMLNKVKSASSTSGSTSGSGNNTPQPGVLLHGEEAKQRLKQPSHLVVSGPSPANTNAPGSPVEGDSPIDTSSSFDISAAQRVAAARGVDGRLLPSSSFSAYSPIAKQSMTRDDDESELSLDMEDTADEQLLHTTAVHKALSNSASSPSSASSASSLFNRSLNSTRIAQFANTSQVSDGGLSESELHSILAVANSSDATGAVNRADYATLCRHLVRLQAAMKDREKDLRMAGELGEAVCVENTKLEANVEELTHSLDAVVDENARLKEEAAALQRAVDELAHNNQRLSSEQLAQQVDDDFDQAAPSGEGVRRKKGREDSASTALSEFIRSELSTNLLNTSLDSSFDMSSASGASTPTSSSGSSTPTAANKPIKYTGNLILDLTNLQRKLRRERRMWDRNLQALEQAVQLKDKERAQVLAEKNRLESEMNDFRALQSQLLKQNSDWEEREELLREKEERLQHDTKMKLATQRKAAEQDMAVLEEELRKEREERTAESKRRQQLEEKVSELNSRLAELNELVERVTDEKLRAETARQQLEKKVAAAERIVNEVERGKGSEERRREDMERRAELAERAIMQEEQRRLELDLELQQARDSLAEVKQQLNKERNTSQREREERSAEESKLREQLAKEKELREQAVAQEQAAQQAAQSRLVVEAAKKKEAVVITANASTMTTASSTSDAACQTSAPAGLAQSVSAMESVVSAESTASLATPHASARARVSDNQPSTVIAAPSALSPSSSTSSSSPAAPLWVLPHPMFAVSGKDQELLRAMFAFLTHQWTMALLLLVSNIRVKKTVEWIKDKQSNECLSCHSEFGLFTRRHHCRLCGGLYCSDCSNQTVDLNKFKLDNVRVCTPCFQVVGVMTHGESLIVHRTKVNQKIKSGDKKKLKANKDIEPALGAPVRPTVSTASSANTTPRVSAVAAATPTAKPPSALASSAKPASASDLQIVSGTPRLKKAKSIAAVAQPSVAAVSSASHPAAVNAMASPQAVRTALDVTPRGTVNPVVAPAGRAAAVPGAVSPAVPAPVRAAVPAAATTTTTTTTATFSAPASVTQVAQSSAVSDESGVQPSVVKKKKVVRRVKRVVPVV